MIKNAGERAASLTRQLLTFSRKQVLQPQALNLNNIVVNTEKMLQHLIGEDIELLTTLERELGLVKADSGQLEQVIMNLAVNARDAMPQGGRLSIETANVYLDKAYVHQHLNVRPGQYVMLTISDTGDGMDAETQSHIFEPFFTTKEVGKGTGLGLATVHGIINQSGGHIRLYSEPDYGTTFKLYLPQVEESVKLSKPLLKSPESYRGSETILLVEDKEMVRTLVHKILTEFGYTVLEARNGNEALSTAQQSVEPIHLLLTDVVMPEMGGVTLAAQLKSTYPAAKVLLMSGYSVNTVEKLDLADLGTPFIQKPFSASTLTHKIREVLDS